MSAPEPKVITGVLERITFQNEENGYTVAKLLPDSREQRGQDSLATVIGPLAGAMPGEALELTGHWQHHDQHGWQFVVHSYKSVLPATATGIRKYLGSGLIKGIGPRTAEKIVAHFDVDTLQVFDTAPDRLRDVPGIGAKTVAKIIAAWTEQKAIKDVMIFLQGHGVSTSLAVRIYKQYKDASITIAKNQPYRLAREVHGIGFKTADKIALAMGVRLDDPERLKAGVLFALSEASDEGHTFQPRVQLSERAAELLGVEAVQVFQAIDALITENGAHAEALHRTDDGSYENVPLAASRLRLGEPAAEYGAPAESAIYLLPFFHAEEGIARQLARLRRPPIDLLTEFQTVDFDVVFSWLDATEKMMLADKQKEGVVMALTQPVSVLTGGPGTGKTTSMRALIRVLQAKRKRIVLAAPTGRAAKRLSEATGLEAKTLHRLLAIRPGGKPQFDADAPLPADIVIVDETSMLDTLLMNTLLKAVATGAHVLFVGDADQLPSVGAGNVLADLIASESLPVVRLEQIFRQSESSAIAVNAHRINSGQMPLTGGEIADFFLFAEDDAEAAAALVVDLVARRIPAKFGMRAMDIQVLAPMHNGKCGVAWLNSALQAALNPPSDDKPQKVFGNRTFRQGDKVLQMRNNYDMDVFNGDGGMIMRIDSVDQVVAVQLEDDRIIEYDFTDLDQLTLAYAISIHKSQGSEYPCVVMPMVMSHFMMLERKLIYTGLTRARKLAVLVGSRKAIGIAVRNGGASGAGRMTGLRARMRQNNT
ncbi:MAG: ATP-dependent RecD-like DNA helicase [Chloroflexi bacterium]|nr:ATP-dependent RecD-like DNA helicase [Chloroflexota bacterium]